MRIVREGERVRLAGIVAVARQPGAAPLPLAGMLHLIDPDSGTALVELDAALGGQVLVAPLALLEPAAQRDERRDVRSPKAGRAARPWTWLDRGPAQPRAGRIGPCAGRSRR